MMQNKVNRIICCFTVGHTFFLFIFSATIFLWRLIVIDYILVIYVVQKRQRILNFWWRRGSFLWPPSFVLIGSLTLLFGVAGFLHYCLSSHIFSSDALAYRSLWCPSGVYLGLVLFDHTKSVVSRSAPVFVCWFTLFWRAFSGLARCILFAFSHSTPIHPFSRFMLVLSCVLGLVGW